MKIHSEKEPSELVQLLVSRLEKLEAKVAELSGVIEQITRKASVPAPAAAKSPGELTPQLLAVIAAAIDTVIKVPHLIHSIHEVDSGKPTFDPRGWSVEGRRQIFSSHRPR